MASCKRTGILVFLNGFLLASCLYFYEEDSYEKHLINAMATYVKDKTLTIADREKKLLLESLHLTHYLGQSRSFVFYNKDLHTIKSDFIHPVTFDLMTANNACGSYTFILSRLLSELHIPNRIAQMKVNGKFGGHILLEAKTEQGWAVMDPLYNLCFITKDGSLASIDDVHNNWSFYTKQVPPDYNYAYNYEGVRYTNWEKIPVIMPFIKEVLTLFIGKEEIKYICLRMLILRKYHLIFEITIGLFFMQILVVIYKYLRKNILRAIYLRAVSQLSQQAGFALIRKDCSN
jgi:hypothetical protein